MIHQRKKIHQRRWKVPKRRSRHHWKIQWPWSKMKRQSQQLSIIMWLRIVQRRNRQWKPNKTLILHQLLRRPRKRVGRIWKWASINSSLARKCRLRRYNRHSGDEKRWCKISCRPANSPSTPSPWSKTRHLMSSLSRFSLILTLSRHCLVICRKCQIKSLKKCITPVSSRMSNRSGRRNSRFTLKLQMMSSVLN